jgi:hypothetical protein
MHIGVTSHSLAGNCRFPFVYEKKSESNEPCKHRQGHPSCKSCQALNMNSHEWLKPGKAWQVRIFVAHIDNDPNGRQSQATVHSQATRSPVLHMSQQTLMTAGRPEEPALFRATAWARRGLPA